MQVDHISPWDSGASLSEDIPSAVEHQVLFLQVLVIHNAMKLLPLLILKFPFHSDQLTAELADQANTQTVAGFHSCDDTGS